MPIANVADYAAALTGGGTVTGHFRKVPSQATVAGWWADLSMASGSPVPNFYAAEPLVFATLSAYKGIYHGPAASPDTKVLTHLELVSPTAGMVGQYKLLDYIGFYPFVDMDSDAAQVMDNAVTLLPQPLSPTRQTVSPASTFSDTPSTARRLASSTTKSSLRSLISSSGMSRKVSVVGRRVSRGFAPSGQTGSVDCSGARLCRRPAAAR